METKAKKGYILDETEYEIVFEAKADEEVVEVEFNLINKPDIPYEPPKTGDSSNIIIFAIMGLLSLLSIVGLTLTKKKRNI